MIWAQIVGWFAGAKVKRVLLVAAGGFLIVAGAYLYGYLSAREDARERTARQAVENYKARNKIDEETHYKSWPDLRRILSEWVSD